MIKRPACATFALTAVLAGCGSSPGGKAAPDHVTIAIEDFAFAPARTEVRAGAKVTFTNADRAPHTATAGGGFDTGVLMQGASKTVTIARQGTFAYVCALHPYMKATVVVRPR
jgi:plastocyanin